MSIHNNTKPAFIYAYSIFESTITEILRYYLNAFPEKIDKNIKIDKDELLATSKTKDIISQLINHYIRKFSSDTLFNYLTFFSNTLSIENNIDKASVFEISTWRNKIVHDNAQAELMYKHIHNRQREQTLSISQLKHHIKKFADMLKQIKEQINFKYHKYTKEHLVRELWGYAFSSPLLSFDSIWEFDNDGALKIKDVDIVKKQIYNISSSEHLLLSVFLQQYNDTLNKTLHSFGDIPALVSLDSESKDKLVNIINFFEYHPLFFCGEILLDTLTKA